MEKEVIINIAKGQSCSAKANSITETNKKLKDKAKKSQNKKIIAALKKEQKVNKNKIAKLGRQVKSIAKDNARKEAALLCPKLSDFFSRKKDDGRAESLLIAKYIKDNA